MAWNTGAPAALPITLFQPREGLHVIAAILPAPGPSHDPQMPASQVAAAWRWGLLPGSGLRSRSTGQKWELGLRPFRRTSEELGESLSVALSAWSEKFATKTPRLYRHRGVQPATLPEARGGEDDNVVRRIVIGHPGPSNRLGSASA